MTQTIKQIHKKFPDEWLLIEVVKMDEATTTPLTGKLLAHSPDRDLIYKKSLAFKGMIFIDHAGNRLPEGYAVAF